MKNAFISIFSLAVTLWTCTLSANPQTQLDSSGSTWFFIDAAQTLRSAGLNHRGQRGVDGDAGLLLPVAANIQTVALGADHGLALSRNGEVLTWGSNIFGQTPPTAAPTVDSTLGPARFIAAGAYSSYVVCGNVLWSRGRNNLGQLGRNSTSDGGFAWGEVSLPVGPIDDLAAGVEHVLVIVASNLYGFGSNGFHQLGSVGSSNVPVLIDSTRRWVKVRAGAFHNLAQTEAGSVYAWGKNNHGQLGLGSVSAPVSTLSQISLTHPLRDMAAGNDHSALLLDDEGSGLLWLFGSSQEGQLGIRDHLALNPVVISVVNDLAAGPYSTLFLRGRDVYGMGQLTPQNKSFEPVLLYSDTTVPITDDASPYLALSSGNSMVGVTWPTLVGAVDPTLYWSLSPSVSTSSANFAIVAGNTYVITQLNNGVPIYVAVGATVNGVFSLSPESSAMPNGTGGDYIVVDVSAGPTATSYPVNILNLSSSDFSGADNLQYKTGKMVFKHIPAGSFAMGSTTLGGSSIPEHPVVLTKDFYAGVFSVTQQQWVNIMGTHPYQYYENTNSTVPLHNVSWEEIRGSSDLYNWPMTPVVDPSTFMGRLQAKTGLPFDLPTEAEWEYSCKAGTTTRYSFGEGNTAAERAPYMWTVGNDDSFNGMQEVGGKLPNPWGLFDMHGNVWNICRDWSASYPNSDQQTDPMGPTSGTTRVLRGGDFNYYYDWSYSATRWEHVPNAPQWTAGFRVFMKPMVKDLPGFALSKSSLQVGENGGSNTFKVILNAIPSLASSVVLNLVSDTNELMLSPTTLTFTRANWNLEQTVTVTGVDDSFARYDATSISVSVDVGASDSVYGSVASKYLVVNLADDDAPLMLSMMSGNSMVGASWMAVAGSSNYTLYWDETSASGLNSENKVTIMGNSFVVTGLANDTNYYFSVQSNGTGSSSALSPEAMASASASGGDYIGVDVSAGPTATSYPVSVLNLSSSDLTGTGNLQYKTGLIVLKQIPAGSFTMGNTTVGGGSVPEHPVVLTKDFYAGVFEVTQQQWLNVMGSYPSGEQAFENTATGNTMPMHNVSWDDIRGLTHDWPTTSTVGAGTFMGNLLAKTGLPFDLPTEAEWEYTCRSGTTTLWSYGDTENGNYMWYDFNNTPDGTKEVGGKDDNAWGLYDLHGNVWEWCRDWYETTYPTLSEHSDPSGGSHGSFRVRRGGSFGYTADSGRSASRGGDTPSSRNSTLGFRLFMGPKFLPPPAPTGLAATAGEGQVSLSWLVVDEANSYKIYRDQIFQTTSTTNSFTDTGLTNDTLYTYSVSAINSTGESLLSQEASATTTSQTTTILPPTDLSTEILSFDAVRLTWSEASGATKYKIYRDDNYVDETTSTSFNDYGLNVGTYEYTVSSVDGQNVESQQSSGSLIYVDGGN